jgi:ATP-dependent Clp protease ATP-binding subunit ClpA
MFERFTREARAVVKDADGEARRLGSRTIEAEHMLLALAGHEPLGLDRDEILSALEAERERSLMAVGIAAGDFDLRPAPVTRPKMATSAKIALERSLRASMERSDRRIEAGHILLGVLAAEAGTVPRALTLADIDRDALRERADAWLRRRTAGTA